MKKILIIAAAAIVVLGSCSKGSIPSGNPKTDLDTLSYELGVANSQGVKMYLANQLGVDTAYMDEFYKGFAAAAQAGDDKKLAAYYAGIQIGQQIGTQVYSAANSELFGQDSTKTVNLEQLVAGFIEGTKGEPIIPMETIRTELNKRVEAYKDQYLSKTFGDNKKKSDEFIAKKATEEGVEKLKGGTLYKVLTKGNGPVPQKGAKVQVIYEGKTAMSSTALRRTTRASPPRLCSARLSPHGRRHSPRCPRALSGSSMYPTTRLTATATWVRSSPTPHLSSKSSSSTPTPT